MKPGTWEAMTTKSAPISSAALSSVSSRSAVGSWDTFAQRPDLDTVQRRLLFRETLELFAIFVRIVRNRTRGRGGDAHDVKCSTVVLAKIGRDGQGFPQLIRMREIDGYHDRLVHFRSNPSRLSSRLSEAKLGLWAG